MMIIVVGMQAHSDGCHLLRKTDICPADQDWSLCSCSRSRERLHRWLPNSHLPQQRAGSQGERTETEGLGGVMDPREVREDPESSRLKYKIEELVIGQEVEGIVVRPLPTIAEIP